jgi:hypothetical protein
MEISLTQTLATIIMNAQSLQVQVIGRLAPVVCIGVLWAIAIG